MIYINEMINSIILGIIEGIIEFFPISSTGHLIIITHYFDMGNQELNALEIFTQLGSSLGMLICFYKKIKKILKINKNKKKIIKHYIYALLVSIVPTIVIGLTFYTSIKLLSNVVHVIYGLLFGGFLLIFSEIFKPKKSIINSLKEINLIQSFIIGCFQVLSLYPGFSRSGSTISTGILLGLKRSVAIDFSFIISIPLILGASIFDLIKNIQNTHLIKIPYYFGAFFTSFIISLIFFKILINLLKKISLIFFAIYRILLSFLIYFDS